MPLKVGVTSGMYSAARSAELSSVVRKLGFGLTRGTSVIQIDQDVPHEVNETIGKEVRDMAEKQGLDLAMHGSLYVPLDMPERSEYRDAQDHLQKSVRSAVLINSKYVVFHACLNIWLELMTYAGRKLTMAFVDHNGHFISDILYECKDLRWWFVKERGYDYLRDILTRDEMNKMQSEIAIENEEWYKREIQKRMRKAGIPEEVIDRVVQTGIMGDIPAEYFLPNMTGKPAPEEIKKALRQKKEKEDAGVRILDRLRKDRIVHSSDTEEAVLKRTLMKKLGSSDPGVREWESEELRAVVGILDGYMIMAHYLFYKKDPVWMEFAKLYENMLVGEYGMDYNNKEWLHNAWKKAESKNDKRFKEFLYGVVGAKFLEGHMRKLLEWMDDEEKGLKKEIDDMNYSDEEKEKLKKTVDSIVIAIESPDARDPQHAGLHILWEPRQIYAAVKVIRRFAGDRVAMLIDWEHVATQGIDPMTAFKDITKTYGDFGALVVAVHSGQPNPTHAHEPLEIGDVNVYTLLWYLRRTGMGKEDRTAYIIFERGAGDDPYRQSIEFLKLCIKFLEMDTQPEDLPLEFFGMAGPTTADIRRQMQIVREHAEEPLKDLLEMSEEEWGIFSEAAKKKGRLDVWKKERFK